VGGKGGISGWYNPASETPEILDGMGERDSHEIETSFFDS
jgi:hypothetical protein